MNTEFLLWLQRLRTPFFDGLFQCLTYLGEETLLVAALCFIYWCLNKRLAQSMLFGFFASGLTAQLLKIVFCVPRPWLLDARLVPVESARKAATGFSFPSGHTASATAAYGSIARYFRRRWLSWASAAVILLVGFSRLYLGVHTPADVLASLMVSTVMVFAAQWLLGALERRPGRDVWVLGCGVALSAAFALYAQFKPYPQGDAQKLALDAFKASGTAIGLCGGWFWERRAIRFETRARPVLQMLKYGQGMLLILALMLVPWPFSMLNPRLGALIRYALISFTAVGFWPYLFNKFGSRLT